MTLDGIEGLLMTRYPKGVKSYKVNLIRYADDLIITAASEDLAKEIKLLLTDFLKERGLELSDEKTLITNINDGFDFLSWNFRKYNDKLLIKPSKQSIKKFTENISQAIHKGQNWSQASLIDKLNPMIRGWTNYHKSSVSFQTFQNLYASSGNYCGNGRKEDILTNPNIGLLINIGRKVLLDAGTSARKKMNSYLCPIQK